MRPGHTLLELAAGLLLASLGLAAILPAGAGLRDRLAVVGAREAVAGLAAEARSAALVFGGADVRVASDPWRAWVQVGDSSGPPVALERELGVTVELSRDRRETILRYDAMGLGRVANETLRFRRGAAERSLVISSYGRIRRP